MTCFVNGLPMTEAVWRVNAATVAGAGQQISINWLAPSNVILQQVTATWGAQPTTSQNLTMTKDAFAGSAYDTVLIAWDPAASSATDLVCNQPFWFVKGDRVLVTFVNTDNLEIGVELILRQVM